MAAPQYSDENKSPLKRPETLTMPTGSEKVITQGGVREEPPTPEPAPSPAPKKDEVATPGPGGINMKRLGALYRLEAAGKLPEKHQVILDRLRNKGALPNFHIGIDDPTFDAAEEHYGLPPGMLRAVGGIESAGRSNARSPTGVTGIMQVTQETGRPYGLTSGNRLNPYMNIDIAARHLKDLLVRSKGDVRKAVSLYGDQNEPGYAGKVMTRWKKQGIFHLIV